MKQSQTEKCSERNETIVPPHDNTCVCTAGEIAGNNSTELCWLFNDWKVETWEQAFDIHMTVPGVS